MLAGEEPQDLRRRHQGAPKITPSGIPDAPGPGLAQTAKVRAIRFVAPTRGSNSGGGVTSETTTGTYAFRTPTPDSRTGPDALSWLRPWSPGVRLVDQNSGFLAGTPFRRGKRSGQPSTCRRSW